MQLQVMSLKSVYKLENCGVKKSSGYFTVTGHAYPHYPRSIECYGLRNHAIEEFFKKGGTANNRKIPVLMFLRLKESKNYCMNRPMYECSIMEGGLELEPPHFPESVIIISP